MADGTARVASLGPVLGALESSDAALRGAARDSVPNLCDGTCASSLLTLAAHSRPPARPDEIKATHPH